MFPPEIFDCLPEPTICRFNEDVDFWPGGRPLLDGASLSIDEPLEGLEDPEEDPNLTEDAVLALA